jgi:hypothetical protein
VPIISFSKLLKSVTITLLSAKTISAPINKTLWSFEAVPPNAVGVIQKQIVGILNSGYICLILIKALSIISFFLLISFVQFLTDFQNFGY